LKRYKLLHKPLNHKRMLGVVFTAPAAARGRRVQDIPGSHGKVNGR
jgi:hypothetical protein